jgi:hypothetical protein
MSNDGRPHTNLFQPEQGSNQLASVPSGAITGLTSLKGLGLVRDAPWSALAFA